LLGLAFQVFKGYSHANLFVSPSKNVIDNTNLKNLSFSTQLKERILSYTDSLTRCTLGRETTQDRKNLSNLSKDSKLNSIQTLSSEELSWVLSYVVDQAGASVSALNCLQPLMFTDASESKTVLWYQQAVQIMLKKRIEKGQQNAHHLNQEQLSKQNEAYNEQTWHLLTWFETAYQQYELLYAPSDTSIAQATQLNFLNYLKMEQSLFPIGTVNTDVLKAALGYFRVSGASVASKQVRKVVAQALFQNDPSGLRAKLLIQHGVLLLDNQFYSDQDVKAINRYLTQLPPQIVSQMNVLWVSSAWPQDTFSFSTGLKGIDLFKQRVYVNSTDTEKSKVYEQESSYGFQVLAQRTGELLGPIITSQADLADSFSVIQDQIDIQLNQNSNQTHDTQNFVPFLSKYWLVDTEKNLNHALVQANKKHYFPITQWFFMGRVFATSNQQRVKTKTTETGQIPLYRLGLYGQVDKRYLNYDCQYKQLVCTLSTPNKPTKLKFAPDKTQVISVETS
jgi:hypothetical protein